MIESDTSPQAARALEGRHVLLVEDSPDQSRLYLRYLQRAGAEVTLECYGQSAVETVEGSPHSFDVVVMDLEMPGIDGIEATRQLRELGFEGAVIAVTAHGSEEKKQSWFQAGCSAFLEKPLNEQLLVSTIGQHLTPVKV